MADLEGDQKKAYEKMANDHADFLCFKIFKPAYIIAFMHGAKHMKEDMLKKGYVNIGET